MRRGWAAAAALALLAGCAAPATRPSETLQEIERELTTRDDYALRWRAARAALAQVDQADTPDRERVTYARKALQHADGAVRLDSAGVEGHFYRAVALGRVLEHSALPNPARIGDLEAAGQRARELDPSFSCAGPLRLLALLYLKAPPWPVGPELAGEEDVIEALFTEAVELAPGCPENRVAYAEFLKGVGREAEATTQARQAKSLLQQEPHVSQLSAQERRELARRAAEVLASSRP